MCSVGMVGLFDKVVPLISFFFFLSRTLFGIWNVLFPGGELLDWFSLPDIEPHSLISIFHMDGDTFVIVAHDVSVKLFNIKIN